MRQKAKAKAGIQVLIMNLVIPAKAGIQKLGVWD
jgi:hypothetical protein